MWCLSSRESMDLGDPAMKRRRQFGSLPHRPYPRCTRYSISSLHLDCAVAGSLQMREIRVATKKLNGFLDLIRMATGHMIGFVYWSVNKTSRCTRYSISSITSTALWLGEYRCAKSVSPAKTHWLS